MAAAEEHGIGMIDMIVVNLYAFEATYRKEGVTFEEAIENIDIGGPSMLRSAAKNHASVAVVTSLPCMLPFSMKCARTAVLLPHRRAPCSLLRCSVPPARMTMRLHVDERTDQGASSFASEKRLFLSKEADLRYGENPHQQAAFYKLDNPDFEVGCKDYTLSNAVKIQGKELSYNNYLDLDAAWAAVREFEDAPACVIVIHLTPCGIAKDEDIVEAYKSGP